MGLNLSGQTLPEVQNRGISGPTKGLMSSKNVKINFLISESKEKGFGAKLILIRNTKVDIISTAIIKSVWSFLPQGCLSLMV